MQKGQALIFVLAGVLLVALITGGVFYLGRISTKKPASQNPIITSQITPTPSPVLDETANWRNITKSEVGYGYTFKYSDEWVARDPNDTSEDGIILKTKDLNMVDYSNINNGALIYGPYILGVVSEVKSLEELATKAKTPRNGITILSEKDLTLDGQPAKEIVSLGSNYAEVYVMFKYPQPFKIYDTEANFSWMYLLTSKEGLEFRQKTFEKMLSTFKFL